MIVKVCKGKTCMDRFSEYIITRLENDKEFYKKDNLIIEDCKCLGRCKEGPNLLIDKQIFNKMDPAKASKRIFNK